MSRPRGSDHDTAAAPPEWSTHLREASTEPWWVPAGVRPAVADADQRLESLRRHGPTRYAFGVRSAFPPPGHTTGQRTDDDWFCPA